MADSMTLARKTDPEASPFDVLKREGLSLVQELSGGIWTDYNLHDPGVTILDQLCYALSELSYRSEFPVEDYLAGPDGSIDLAAQALHLPEEVLPCRPATVADFRNAVFSEVPEIDDIWIEPVTGCAPRGLYRVAVRLHDGTHGVAAVKVLEKVRRAFCRFRSLCEDLDAEITVVPEVVCELHARIEVCEEAEPAELLARIYHGCMMKIADGLRFRPFTEALEEGKALDEILCGPFTGYGVACQSDAAADGGGVRIADLFSIISAVPGVEEIRDLHLSEGGRMHYDYLPPPRKRCALRLLVPGRESECRVILTRNGRRIDASMRDLRARYDELHFRHHSMRRVPHDLQALLAKPRGLCRDLAEYYSIQNHFPEVYGVSERGLPASAPAEHKGKVAQLKGYLLLFEQLMANFTADLARLRTLFSVEEWEGRSYSSQTVRQGGTPPLNELYADGAGAAFADIIREHDPWAERRNRLLDYLTALYGERFGTDSFRRFDWYAPPGEGERRLLAAKAAFLKSVVSAGRDRGAGLDYLDGRGTVPGLQRRVSLLLGLPHPGRRRPLTAALAGRKMKLVSDDAASRQFSLIFLEDVKSDAASWESVPVAPSRMSADRRAMRSEVAAMRPMSGGVIPESLLRRGIDLANYRVAQRGGSWKLLFTPDHEQSWWHLASYPGLIPAFRGANLLSRYLAVLNERSEGLHVLEHILLRPVSDEGGRAGDRPADFYSLRVSVLLPAYTARCSDAAFREVVEDLVVEQCPAHVFPHFHWLEPDELQLFETHYFRWLELLRGASGAAVERDQAAARLVRFLQERERQA